jgi:hypothetical protein
VTTVISESSPGICNAEDSELGFGDGGLYNYSHLCFSDAPNFHVCEGFYAFQLEGSVAFAIPPVTQTPGPSYTSWEFQLKNTKSVKPQFPVCGVRIILHHGVFS